MLPAQHQLRTSKRNQAPDSTRRIDPRAPATAAPPGPDERRVSRSPWASQALCIQLRQVTQRYQLSTMVLADSAGHLWAKSGPDPAAAVLARDLFQQGLLDHQELISIRRGRRAISIKPLRVAAARLFLIAEGAQRRSRTALTLATAGVQRILQDLMD